MPEAAAVLGMAAFAAVAVVTARRFPQHALRTIRGVPEVLLILLRLILRLLTVRRLVRLIHHIAI